jgi:hypothetical protein
VLGLNKEKYDLYQKRVQKPPLDQKTPVNYPNISNFSFDFSKVKDMVLSKKVGPFKDGRTLRSYQLFLFYLFFVFFITTIFFLVLRDGLYFIMFNWHYKRNSILGFFFFFLIYFFIRG